MTSITWSLVVRRAVLCRAMSRPVESETVPSSDMDSTNQADTKIACFQLVKAGAVTTVTRLVTCSRCVTGR